MSAPDNESSSGSLDAQAILRKLPHRYPMLLVDRVLECVPGRRISAIRNLSRTERCFATDASGRTSGISHLLVVESLAQVAVILTFASLGLEPRGDELIFFAGIDNAKFSGSAKPGDQLRLDCAIVRLMRSRGIGKFSARASVERGPIVDVTMIAALQFPNRSGP
ncbi:MAG TPA: 3-hydroxyacyl-[acyl-carrier-protein] dehydratase FabZ [Casimicrobiaceae bacterium]|nr:3-hydroxyacyl-[acyl-carrier-protein] dehydratase FabZ [Casimicrobiaceae bacterium]